ELLTEVAVLVPGFWELVVSDRFEPRFAVGAFVADNAPRHAEPPLAVIGDGRRFVIKATLILADFLGGIAHIKNTIGVKLRPIVQRADDVGAGTGLNRSGGTRLDVVAVDHLDSERDAQILGALRGDLVAQKRVRLGNEIVPAQPMQRCALGKRGRLAGCQYGRHTAAARGQRPSAGNFQESSPTNAWHDSSSLI